MEGLTDTIADGVAVGCCEDARDIFVEGLEDFEGSGSGVGFNVEINVGLAEGVIVGNFVSPEGGLEKPLGYTHDGDCIGTH